MPVNSAFCFIKSLQRIIFLGAMCVLLVLTGCNTERNAPLEIIGDVENPVSIRSLEEAPSTVKIDHRDKSVLAIPLEEFILQAKPYGDSFGILYQAHDGFSAFIARENLQGCYIALTEGNGWEAINLNHPVSNIKDLRNIVIISRDLSYNQKFNIIEPGRNIAGLSVGTFYKDGYSVLSVPRGTATFTPDGEDLHAKRHKVINLEDYVSLAGRDSIIVVGKKGEIEPLRQDGRFTLNKNSVGYIAGNEVAIPRVAGVVLDPPDRIITDVYHDAKNILSRGERVLIILIDGLGYHQYTHALEHGFMPFIESLPEPEMAMAAYPPVTPVNVAASLTGELPHINGVFKRGIRQTEVPTIFGFCKDQELASAAIIGPIGTIELEIDPVFSLDTNQDGSTDDEKTANALEIISADYDLIFVHYKDVDSIGHAYGDLHQETLATISKIDGYVEQLLSNWTGKVLIYADHGMHQTEEGGDHNALITEDMFIPYWLFDWGETN